MKWWAWALVGASVIGGGAMLYAARADFKKASELRTSPAGIDEIKRSEGSELRAYKDIAGLWTIGTGHLVQPGEMAQYVGRASVMGGKPRGSVLLTQVQADEILRADLRMAESYVHRYVKVPITQGMFDALVSFVFNLGGGSLSESTLLKKLNAGEYVAAASEFMRWNKAAGAESAGLTARRDREKALFLQGVA